jgi:hypothetical protein
MAGRFVSETGRGASMPTGTNQEQFAKYRARRSEGMGMGAGARKTDFVNGKREPSGEKAKGLTILSANFVVMAA